jgi:alcohol dehydrogenase class IV
MDLNDRFLWHDGGRLIAFRSGAIADAPEIARSRGWDPFELISTARALSDADELRETASAVHKVPRGEVPALAGELIDKVATKRLVALGGGRVIDVAKAVAAAREGGVCAIPTTLAGAEMNSIGRLVPGHEDVVRVRPALVLADPALMTSLPEQPLRASAMNALAHGTEALFTRMANPAAGVIALHGASLIASSLDHEPDERPRADLALGALFCSWAMESAGFALHHVISQTLVRECGAPHAETNAIMLPVTIGALARRSPKAAERVASALTTETASLGERVRELADEPRRLSDLGLDQAQIAEVPELALERPELRNLAEVPTRAELEELLETAW